MELFTAVCLWEGELGIGVEGKLTYLHVAFVL